VIPQFFDVLEIKFQTEFKWDTNERGGMLQRMIIFTDIALSVLLGGASERSEPERAVQFSTFML